MNAKQFLEKTFSAVAFAEANEHDKALAYLHETPQQQVADGYENTFNLENVAAAVAFAEAGQDREARHICGLEHPRQEQNHNNLEAFLQNIGIDRNQTWYGTASL